MFDKKKKQVCHLLLLYQLSLFDLHLNTYIKTRLKNTFDKSSPFQISFKQNTSVFPFLKRNKLEHKHIFLYPFCSILTFELLVSVACPYPYSLLNLFSMFNFPSFIHNFLYFFFFKEIRLLPFLFIASKNQIHSNDLL